MTEGPPPSSDLSSPSQPDETPEKTAEVDGIIAPDEPEGAETEAPVAAAGPERPPADETPPDAESSAETPSSPPPTPSPPAPPEKTAPLLTPVQIQVRSRAWGCLRDIVLVLLSTLAGAALALAILVGINGSLDSSRNEILLSLRSQTETLTSDYEHLLGQVQEDYTAQATIQSDLANAQKDIRQLTDQTATLDQQIQTLSAQVGQLQTNIDGLNDTVQGISTTVGALSQNQTRLEEDVGAITAQMNNLLETAARFEHLAKGLQELSQTLNPPANTAANATATPTVSITQTLSPSPTYTATQPVKTTTPPAEATSTPPPQTPTPKPISGSSVLDLFPPKNPIYPPQPGQSHIFGLVWEDLNGNGQPEAGEKPITSVVILLRDASGRELDSSVTGSDGRFLFSNLAPGTYIVVELDPRNSESITPNTMTVTTTADSVVEVNFADIF